MTEIKFNKIMSGLQQRIDTCAVNTLGVTCRDDILKLSVEDAIHLASFCKAEVNRQFKIVSIDMYHLVGMSDLTPPQMSKLVYKIREYLQYRPLLKALAANLNDLQSIPHIPTGCKYELSFTDVLLSTCPQDTTTPVFIDSPDGNPFCFDIDTSGYFIRVHAGRIPEFTSELKKVLKLSSLKESTVVRRMQEHSCDPYCGIRWDYTGGDPDYYIGTLTTTDIRAQVLKYMEGD